MRQQTCIYYYFHLNFIVAAASVNLLSLCVSSVQNYKMHFSYNMDPQMQGNYFSGPLFEDNWCVLIYVRIFLKYLDYKQF